MRKILIKTDVHNAFRECPEVEESYTRNLNPKVEPHLHPLFAELSKKRPTWTYKASDHGRPDGSGYTYSRFTIMEGDEELGKVWSERHWRTDARKFGMDNVRMRGSRQRGSCTETKDMKKAVKLILGNMYPTTPDEFMQSARSEGMSKLNTELQVMHRRYITTKNTLEPIMERFALVNPDVVKAFDPSATAIIDTLLLRSQDVEVVKKQRAYINHDKTSVVVERAGKCYVERADTAGVFSIYTLTELPDRLKRVVGMLKLTSEGTLVPDLGFRVSGDTYIAFDE